MNVHSYTATVPEVLKARSESTPNKNGFCFHSTEYGLSCITWSYVWNEVQIIAKSLRRHGLSKGDRLAIILPPIMEWELANQAGLLVGSSIVGIECTSSIEHIEYILKDSKASVVILDRNGIWNEISSLVKRKLKLVVGLHAESLELDSTPFISWTELRKDTVPSEQAIVPPDMEDAATLIYTSGTTGRPKAIEFTHHQLVLASHTILEFFPQLHEQDSTICWLPMSHLFQRMVNLMAIESGMIIHFVDSPQDIRRQLNLIKPSFFAAVPRFYEKLAEELRKDQGEELEWIKSIKIALTGSAPIQREILEFLNNNGLMVLEAYGLSENVVPISANSIVSHRFGSVGKVLETNKIRLQSDGEILVRGPGVFKGYLGDDRSYERFTEDGYYRTGDCGRLDREGFLYLTGRKAEIIKTSTGRRISPVRIEAEYSQCSLVEHVVVVGNGRKYLAALLTLNVTEVRKKLENKFGSRLTAVQMSMLPEVRKFISECFTFRDQNLEFHERVAKFAILPRSLSMSREELTSTGKLRRLQIEHNFKSIVKSLYQSADIEDQKLERREIYGDKESS